MSISASTPSSTEPAPQKDEEQRLRELGYQPVLARRMGGFGNFAISFSVISILSGCMTLYGFGMSTGGPSVMLWGWAGVGLFVLCVGMALAEVTSAYPTSGALYYMADRLGGRKWGWYTGWLNLLGLLGAIAGIDYGAALFTGALLNLQWGFDPTPGHTMVIFLCILLLHAVLNLFGVRLVSVLNSISVWWHLAGVAVIVTVLAVVPSNHQSPSFVFTEFVNDTGWENPLYVAAIGLLLAQYTFCGYDASAHLSEETSNASVTAAKGIVRAIWVSWGRLRRALTTELPGGGVRSAVGFLRFRLLHKMPPEVPAAPSPEPAAAPPRVAELVACTAAGPEDDVHVFRPLSDETECGPCRRRAAWERWEQRKHLVEAEPEPLPWRERFAKLGASRAGGEGAVHRA
nr:amino acid permease [Streptomyces sp. FT05W]